MGGQGNMRLRHLLARLGCRVINAFWDYRERRAWRRYRPLGADAHTRHILWAQLEKRGGWHSWWLQSMAVYGADLWRLRKPGNSTFVAGGNPSEFATEYKTEEQAKAH